MGTRNSILDMVEKDHQRPIYEIFLIEYPNKEMIGKDGKRLGWPDEGATANMGFYYDIDDAIEAMHTNRCDIQERVYHA